MIEFSDYELNEYIKNDIPYFDLTTYLQNCNNKKARIEIFTREDIIVSCIEEACKIVRLLNCEVQTFAPSKIRLQKGDVLISFYGEYNNIHKAWRAVQILLEYSCKISTKARQMKDLIDEVNKNCELLTTRKTFPFAKKFCLKASMTGGAIPHRLGLSESILFFNGHRIIYENINDFYKEISNIKKKVPEKKIVVESESFEDAKNLLTFGVDVLQLDKISLDELKEIVDYKNERYKEVKILAAGGINQDNIKEYAKTKIDGIVTSSVYNAGMANLGSRIEII